MRHPVERDCQRPAETIPNFFKIAMIMRRRYLGLFRHSHVEHRQLAAIFSVVNQEFQPQRTYPHFVRHPHNLLAKSIFSKFCVILTFEQEAHRELDSSLSCFSHRKTKRETCVMFVSREVLSAASRRDKLPILGE